MKKALILLSGETASRIGNNLFDLAIIWYVNKLTTNSFVISAVTALFNAVVLLNVVTGMVADRHKKINLLILIDVLQTVLMVFAAFLYINNGVSELSVIVVAFISKALGTFFDPAETALIPQLVSEEQLESVNGINQSLQMIAQLIGTMIGGVLLSYVSLADFLWIDTTTFIISLGALLILKSMHKENVTITSAEKDSNFAGFKFFSQQHELKQLVLIAMTGTLFIGPVMSLDVIWMTHTLHGNSFMYSLSQVLLIVGIVAGSILASHIKLKLISALTLALAMMGCALVILSTFKSIVVTLIAMTFFGLFAGSISVKVLTRIQTVTPKNVLGSVSGVVLAISNISMPVGMLIGGAVSTYITVGETFRGSGIMLVAVAIIVMLLNRSNGAKNINEQ